MAKKQKKFRLKRKERQKLCLLTLIILICSLTAIMLLTPVFDIKEIKVMGNSVVKTQDIKVTSGITTGVNTFNVSLSKAEKNIEKMGYIDKADVKRRLPSTIEILVTEAAGVACIPAEKGYIVITADGRTIGKADKRTDDSVKNLPIIKGLKDIKYKIGNPLKSPDKQRLNDLIKFLRAFSGEGYVFDMSEIDVSNISDIRFIYKDKLLVRVGDVSKIDYKSEIFTPILKELGEDIDGVLDLERQTFGKKQEAKTVKKESSETPDKKTDDTKKNKTENDE